MAYDAVIQVGAQLDASAISNLSRDLNRAVSHMPPLKIRIDNPQALGRISQDAAEFQKSLAASNARVLAFTASAGQVYAVKRAFDAVLKSTIEVQKSLTDINVVLGVSSKTLTKFGDDLFDVANQTGQSFKTAAAAATEFSRQGLGVEETLKRTRDALTLTRLSGLEVEKSVGAITAALNGFNDVALDSTSLINKMATVDAAFAVSSRDLAESFQRVGSTAKDTGVEINSLMALVTSAQQTTARGGAVIGNALKTIFQRIQRPEVIETLKEMNVSVEDLAGNIKPADQVLLNLAKAYQGLGQTQKNFIVQLASGVFQANQFRALLNDLAKDSSIYSGALNLAANATDQAAKRQAELNKTFSASINEMMNNLVRASSRIGELSLGPALNKFVTNISSIAEKVSDQKGEDSIGSTIGRGILKGIGEYLTGPGMVAGGAVLWKFMRSFAEFSRSAMSALMEHSSQEYKTRNAINGLLARQPQLMKEIVAGSLNQEQIHRRILEILNQELVTATKLGGALSSGNALINSGAAVVRNDRLALNPKRFKNVGFVPETVEKIGALNAGYKPGKVKEIYIPRFGKAVYNTAETVKYFPNFSQPAIIPPKSSRAGNAYKSKFIQTHGFDPYKAKGFVPSFANPANFKTDAQSVLNYEKNPDSFELINIVSKRKGDAYALFGQLFDKAKESNLPVLSSKLTAQPRNADSPDALERLFTLFPELRYRADKGRTSGEYYTGEKKKYLFKTLSQLFNYVQQGKIDPSIKDEIYNVTTFPRFNGFIPNFADSLVDPFIFERTRNTNNIISRLNSSKAIEMANAILGVKSTPIGLHGPSSWGGIDKQYNLGLSNTKGFTYSKWNPAINLLQAGNVNDLEGTLLHEMGHSLQSRGDVLYKAFYGKDYYRAMVADKHKFGTFPFALSRTTDGLGSPAEENLAELFRLHLQGGGLTTESGLQIPLREFKSYNYLKKFFRPMGKGFIPNYAMPYSGILKFLNEAAKTNQFFSLKFQKADGTIRSTKKAGFFGGNAKFERVHGAHGEFFGPQVPYNEKRIPFIDMEIYESLVKNGVLPDEAKKKAYRTARFDSLLEVNGQKVDFNAARGFIPNYGLYNNISKRFPNFPKLLDKTGGIIGKSLQLASYPYEMLFPQYPEGMNVKVFKHPKFPANFLGLKDITTDPIGVMSRLPFRVAAGTGASLYGAFAQAKIFRELKQDPNSSYPSKLLKPQQYLSIGRSFFGLGGNRELTLSPRYFESGSGLDARNFDIYATSKQSIGAEALDNVIGRFIPKISTFKNKRYIQDIFDFTPDQSFNDGYSKSFSGDIPRPKFFDKIDKFFLDTRIGKKINNLFTNKWPNPQIGPLDFNLNENSAKVYGYDLDYISNNRHIEGIGKYTSPFLTTVVEQNGMPINFTKDKEIKRLRSILKSYEIAKAYGGYDILTVDAVRHIKEIDNKYRKLYYNSSSGFIPLKQAIFREKAAGVPENLIRVGKSSKLVSSLNPSGFGVYNLKDEPFGLEQGIRRSISSGKNPKLAGIPNFADFPSQKAFQIQGSNITQLSGLSASATKQIQSFLDQMFNSVVSKGTYDSWNAYKGNLSKVVKGLGLHANQIAAINDITEKDKIYAKTIYDANTTLIRAKQKEIALYRGTTHYGNKTSVPLPSSELKSSKEIISGITQERVDAFRKRNQDYEALRNKFTNLGGQNIGGIISSPVIGSQQYFQNFSYGGADRRFMSALNSQIGAYSKQIEAGMPVNSQAAIAMRNSILGALRDPRNNTGISGDDVKLFDEALGQYLGQRTNLASRFSRDPFNPTNMKVSQIRNANLQGRLLQKFQESISRGGSYKNDLSPLFDTLKNTVNTREERASLAEELRNARNTGKSIYQANRLEELANKINLANSLNPLSRTRRDAERELEKTPEGKAARNLRRQSLAGQAFMGSFVAPMAGAMLSEGIAAAFGTDSRTKRGWVQATSATGNISGMALTGLGLAGGHPLGAVVVGAAGGLMELPKILKAFKDDMPDLVAVFERLKESTQKYSESMEKAVGSTEQLAEINAGRVPSATFGQYNQLQALQAEGLKAIPDKALRDKMQNLITTGNLTEARSVQGIVNQRNNQALNASAIRQGVDKFLKDFKSLSDLQTETRINSGVWNEGAELYYAMNRNGNIGQEREIIERSNQLLAKKQFNNSANKAILEGQTAAITSGLGGLVDENGRSFFDLLYSRDKAKLDKASKSGDIKLLTNLLSSKGKEYGLDKAALGSYIETITKVSQKPEMAKALLENYSSKSMDESYKSTQKMNIALDNLNRALYAVTENIRKADNEFRDFVTSIDIRALGNISQRNTGLQIGEARLSGAFQRSLAGNQDNSYLANAYEYFQNQLKSQNQYTQGMNVLEMDTGTDLREMMRETRASFGKSILETLSQRPQYQDATSKGQLQERVNKSVKMFNSSIDDISSILSQDTVSSQDLELIGRMLDQKISQVEKISQIPQEFIFGINNAISDAEKKRGKNQTLDRDIIARKIQEKGYNIPVDTLDTEEKRNEFQNYILDEQTNKKFLEQMRDVTKNRQGEMIRSQAILRNNLASSNTTDLNTYNENVKNYNDVFARKMLSMDIKQRANIRGIGRQGAFEQSIANINFGAERGSLGARAERALGINVEAGRLKEIAQLELDRNNKIDQLLTEAMDSNTSLQNYNIRGKGDIAGAFEQINQKQADYRQAQLSISSSLTPEAAERERQDIQLKIDDLTGDKQNLEILQKNINDEEETYNKLVEKTNNNISQQLKQKQELLRIEMAFPEARAADIAKSNREYASTAEFEKIQLGDAFSSEWYYNMNAFWRDTADNVQGFSRDFKQAFKEGFGEAAIGAKNFGDAMRDMGISIAQNLVQRSTNQTMDILFGLGNEGLKSFGFMNHKSKGGLIQAFSKGGLVKGGSGSKDDVPALLGGGEFVLKKEAVRKIGIKNLEALNKSNRPPKKDVINVGPNGVRFTLANQYYGAGKDSSHPDYGFFNTSPLLSDFALTDENNPKNRLKFSREKYFLEKRIYENQIEDAKRAFENKKKTSLYTSMASAALTVGGAYGLSQINTSAANRRSFQVGLSAGTSAAGSNISLDSPQTRQVRAAIEMDRMQFGPYSDYYKQGFNQGMWSGYGLSGGHRNGGLIRKYAMGGAVFGGDTSKDSVPAMLMGGEYVMRKEAVDRYGQNFFNHLNGYANGGLVGSINGDSDPFKVSTYLQELINVSQEIRDNIGGKNTQKGKSNPQDSDIQNTINITINVDSQGEVSSKSSAESKGSNRSKTNDSNLDGAKQLGDVMRKVSEKAISENCRPGGIIYEKFRTK